MGTLAATSGVEAGRQGVASGVFNTSQQVGGAVGLAVLATVAGAVTGSAASPTPEALTRGFGVGFLAATGFALAAALAAWALVRDGRGGTPAAVPTGASAHASTCQPAVSRISAPRPEPAREAPEGATTGRTDGERASR